MIKWLRAQLENFANRRMRGLSLVANWLAQVLWLIDDKFLTLAKEAFASNEIVYACLRLLSQSVPEAPLKAYQRDKQNKQVELPCDHPLAILIKRPNELMTEYEFWELTTLQMVIIGRSTWWKERANNGEIIALWPLRPDRVGPIYSKSDKAGERVLAGWSYQVPDTGEYVPLTRQDVLAFNFPDPAGESGGIVEGLGPAQALARQISSDNEATKFVAALLANYAAPSIVLRLKGQTATEKQMEIIKARFIADFAGMKRGMPGVIDADAEIQQIGFNMKELEFPALRDVAETRISAAFGVPAILVGLKAGIDRSTYANFKEARALFSETTLSNYWRRYQDQYTNDIASEFGEGIFCEFDTHQVRGLAGQQLEKLQPVLDAFKVGAATRNEYRIALNLAPVKGGEVFLIPATMLESPATIAAGSAKAVTYPFALKAVDPRNSAERKLQKALEELFAKLSPDVAAKIRRGEVVSDAELGMAFQGVIEPELIAVATAEELAIGGQIGISFDVAVINAAATDWAKTYSYDLVKGITDTTRKLIQNATTKYAATPGMTLGELEGLLSPAFGKVRAEAIAVTEVTRAYSQASSHYQRQLAEAGIDMEKVWHTAHDDLVCTLICVPLNGKPEAVWKADHPTGPPAHVACRCGTTLRVRREAIP